MLWTAMCPHCGEEFTKLNKGTIPTHDFPKPCRSVCPGSGEKPKARCDTPLWKDDPAQEAKDFWEEARSELRIYGFAVVKQMAAYSGQESGSTTCPLCGKQVTFSVSPSNGHCAAACETESCIKAME